MCLWFTMLVLIRGPDCGFPNLPHSNFLFMIKESFKHCFAVIFCFSATPACLNFFREIPLPSSPSPTTRPFQRYFPFPRRWGAQKSENESWVEDWVEMNTPPPKLLRASLLMSGQDEPNPALWLAIRAGKMTLSCPLGLPTMSHKKIVFFLHIINPLLTRLVWPRWLDGDLVIFLRVLWTSTPSRSINTHKRK